MATFCTWTAAFWLTSVNSRNNGFLLQNFPAGSGKFFFIFAGAKNENMDCFFCPAALPLFSFAGLTARTISFFTAGRWPLFKANNLTAAVLQPNDFTKTSQLFHRYHTKSGYSDIVNRKERNANLFLHFNFPFYNNPFFPVEDHDERKIPASFPRTALFPHAVFFLSGSI